jgi:hypothetical protein
MATEESESITPGSTNKTRTTFLCQCCETHFPFDDKNWKSIHDVPPCPGCGEEPFLFLCENCSYTNYQYDECEERPTFPDQECYDCGMDWEDIKVAKKEERRYQKKKKEHERMENAKAYRDRVKNGTHQNNINHTFRYLRGLSNDPFHPVSCPDALRMDEDSFERVRPLMEHELRLRGLHNIEKYITPSCCQKLITFFEQSWLEENEEALCFGVIRDMTGLQHVVFSQRDLFVCRIRLRGIRENMDEWFGFFPFCPAVQLVPDGEDKDIIGPIKAIWSEDWDDEETKNQIYKRDGNTFLTLPEFLVWMCCMGGLASIPENPKYAPQEDSHLGVPADYVPIRYVGNPSGWAEEKNLWFWMREELSTGRISMNELTEMSRKNMMRCRNCYGLPPSNDTNDLISCPCDKYLFCSPKCKDKVMQIHKYSCRKANECASCLISSLFCKDLKLCSGCEKVWYCGLECQRKDWRNHKKNCG